MNPRIDSNESLIGFDVIFQIELVGQFGLFDLGGTLGRLEVFHQNFADLAEPVDVEEIERRRRGDTNELVDDVNRVPGGRDDGSIECDPVGNDCRYANEKEDENGGHTIVKVQFAVLHFQGQHDPSDVDEGR